MSLVHNIVGGGKPLTAFAVLKVNYPQGSVCTCTKGTKVLTAEDTSGTALFLIPESGTWTVASTDGSFTRTIDVQMTTQNEVREITLIYRQWILHDGERPIQMANGVAEQGHSQGSGVFEGTVLWLSAQGASNGIYWHTANPIDVTQFTTLLGHGRKGTNNANFFGIIISQQAIPFGTGSTNYVSNFDYAPIVTMDRTIDITHLTGMWYVGCYLQTNNSINQTSGALTQMFLE